MERGVPGQFFDIQYWPNPLITPNKQIFELLQGRVLFKGRPDPNGAWTAEEDHLAQMMELFGPLPTDLLAEGRSSGSFFDKDGMLKLHCLSLGGYADQAAIAIRVRQVICYISTKFTPPPLNGLSTSEGTRPFMMMKYQGSSLFFSLCCSIDQRIERTLEKQRWTRGFGANSDSTF